MVLRRWAVRLGLALVAVAVALAVAVAFVGRDWIAYGVAQAPNAGRTFRREDDPKPEEYRKLGIDDQLRIEVDGAGRAVSLSVWIIEPKARPIGTVLVLHGIRSDKFWLKGLAKRVALEGYRAVLPDLPGHGRSSGDWLTYGALEAREMKSLVDELDKRGRVTGNLGVVGLSYGAAVGIQFAGIDPRVHAVVAIAPFSSLRAVVPGYVAHYLPVINRLIPSAFVQRAVDRAGVLGHFDPDDASPLSSITRTRTPVLLIHGLADGHIAPAHSVALHAAAPDHSELALVEGADHFSIAGDPTRVIQTRGMQWLHRWLDGTQASASQ